MRLDVKYVREEFSVTKVKWQWPSNHDNLITIGVRTIIYTPYSSWWWALLFDIGYVYELV